MTYDDNPEVARAAAFIRAECESLNEKAEVPIEMLSYRLAILELCDTGEFEVETYTFQGWRYARVTPVIH